MAKRRWIANGCAAAVVVAMSATALACTGIKITVAQNGRAFLLDALTVRQGDTVDIVNDGDTTMHHIYIDDPDFSFDAGDQEPGAKTAIKFTRAGMFTVLCGVHPRMKLHVTVRG